MVEFRIGVRVDPKEAERGINRVDKALERTEQEALDLRKALVDALSARDRGVTSTLRSIEATLERTERQAQVTQTFIGQIGRDVNARGVREVNRELQKTESQAVNLRGVLGKLFAGLSIGFAARQFFVLSDSVTNVNNRLRIVTDSEEELIETQRDLFEIANDTRQAFEGTSTIFNRLAVSADELGVSNRELLNFTKSLNQAIGLSGATAQEANAGLIQLSQGLASGALRGDELRSVLEQLPAVADVIAQGLGVTRGELRLLGQEGKITADVVLSAFRDARFELDERFATTIPTIGQSFSVLGNRITESIGSLNEATGVATGFSQTVLFLAENLDAVVVAAGAATAAIGVSLAAKALPAATTAMRTFLTASGPLVAVGVAATALTVAFSAYTDEIEAAAETLRQLEEDSAFVPSLGAQLSSAQREIANINRAIRAQAARGVEASEAQIARLQQLRGAIEDTRAAIEFNATADERNAQAAAAAAEAEAKQNEALARQEEILLGLREPNREFLEFQSDLDALLKRNAISLDEYSRLLEEARPPEPADVAPTETPDAPADPFAQQLESLQRQNEELRIRNENADVTAQALLIEAELRRQGVELTRAQKDELINTILAQKELSDVAEKRKEQEEAIAKANREQAAAAADEAAAIQRLEEEVDVLGRIREQREQLLALQERRPELSDQVAVALEELATREEQAQERIRNANDQTAKEISASAQLLSEAGDQIADAFANRATSAVVEFTRTGQFAFKEFAASILEDITRIIVRLLIVQAIQSATGLGSGATQAVNTGVGAAQNAGRQFGGTVQPGQAPMPVGENGPELFVPNRTGTIVPNERDRPQERPQVNVQVITVQDSAMVAQSIANGDADEAIVQRIGANKEQVQQVTGG